MIACKVTGRLAPVFTEFIDAADFLAHCPLIGKPQNSPALDEEALTLSVIASTPYRHTRYDELLMAGYERSPARNLIRQAVDRLLEDWRRLAIPGAGRIPQDTRESSVQAPNRTANLIAGRSVLGRNLIPLRQIRRQAFECNYLSGS